MGGGTGGKHGGADSTGSSNYYGSPFGAGTGEDTITADSLGFSPLSNFFGTNPDYGFGSGAGAILGPDGNIYYVDAQGNINNATSSAYTQGYNNLYSSAGTLEGEASANPELYNQIVGAMGAGLAAGGGNYTQLFQQAYQDVTGNAAPSDPFASIGGGQMGDTNNGANNIYGSPYGAGTDYGTSMGGGGGNGFNWGPVISSLGQLGSAFGAYKSTQQNARNAANGPVLPADVQPARNALGDIFLKMILGGQAGTSYGAPPFNLDIGEGNDPYAAVDRYRTASNPAFTRELSSALDSERAKLGGQYGIRFGTDLQKGLGDTAANAIGQRESSLGQLGVSSYDSFMQRRLAELGIKIGDYRTQQSGYLPLIANYLSGQPSSSPFQGGSATGQAFQALGSGLSNLPLYQYLSTH
jgi:hypothetical protein